MQVEEFLTHHGVKGMHWGVRKDEPAGKTEKAKPKPREVVFHKKLANGAELSVERRNLSDYGHFTNWLADKWPSFKTNIETADNFVLKDKDGKRVGEAAFDRSEDGKEFYLDWLSVNKDDRGRGYARAAVQGVVKYAQDNGVERLSMSASEMGAPLYESLGFVRDDGKTKKLKRVNPNSRLKISGDYHMDIPQKVKHADIKPSTKSILDYVAAAIEAADPESEEFLSHHGVKGMHWGVRKDDSSGSNQKGGESGSKLPWVDSSDLKPNADGSITIPKGAVIQRVVRQGRSLLGGGPGNDVNDGVTYAAFTKGDKLRYEDQFGFRKSIFISKSSAVVKLRAKEELKAPTPKKTAEIYFDTLSKNPEQLKAARSYLKEDVLGLNIDLDKAIADPGSKNGYETFGTLFDQGSYDERINKINDGFIKSMRSQGYNMILDPADSTFNGAYDAPIAILEGKRSLDVAGRNEVTKQSQVNAGKALKDYETRNKGKLLMQRLGYSD